MIALAFTMLLAQAPASGGLTSALKSVKQDGPVKLAEDAQQELIAALPPARKGEACPEPPTVAGEAYGLRDRGDGALIVAELTTCKGARVFAVAPGSPPRIARLIDDAPAVRSVKSLALAGGKREEDLALEVSTSPTASDLRLFQRREGGFVFTEAGVLHDFNAVRECSAEAAEGSGWGSFIRPDKAQLAVLRVDGACGGGAWQAACVNYRVDQGALSKSGVCVLPKSLDPKALKAAGWR